MKFCAVGLLMWALGVAGVSATELEVRNWTVSLPDGAWCGVSDPAQPGAIRRALAGKLPKKSPARFPQTLRLRASVPASVPALSPGQRIILSVGHVNGDSTVEVNGKPAGDLPFPGGRLDLTPYWKTGDNTLQFHVSRDGTGIADPWRYFERDWKTDVATLAGVKLEVRPATHLVDVFANASTAAGKLTLEAEIDAAAPGDATLETEFFDAAGQPVRRARKTLRLNRGVQTVKLEIPWKNPIPWEIGNPYRYLCRTVLHAAGATDTYPPFKFGFREIHRDGRDLIMNGHPQRLRTCYPFGVHTPPGAKFLRQIGYNHLFFCHSGNDYSLVSPESLETFDALGIAVTRPGPSVNRVRDNLRNNPADRAKYDRAMRMYCRQIRNSPSTIGVYVSILSGAAGGANSGPENFGRYEETRPQARNILQACEIGRRHNPNILFTNDGDGCCGDLATGFLYLNFTPIQEREEWLSAWAAHGRFPYCVLEFGQPYNGCYWQSNHAYLFTELMCMYYGDRAYAVETPAALAAIVPLGLANRSGHGGPMTPELMPLLWEYLGMITRRTNFAWRAWGLNGGAMYFNLNLAYGNPPTAPRGGYGRYGTLTEDPAGKKPAWANPAYDIYRQGNLDFCGFLGGAPQHTDKTHAFRSGETVEKKLMLIWDGPGVCRARAQWSAELGGRAIAAGTADRTLKTGDIVREPVRFVLPEVEKMTRGVLRARFQDGSSDEFPFEVYPPFRPVPAPAAATAPVLQLFDPDGTTAALLDALKIGYKRLQSPARADSKLPLVFGRFALKKGNFHFSAADLAAGLRVLVLAQPHDAWLALGLYPEERMARTLFLRDRNNPAFAEIFPETLRYWRGAPVYGDKPYGRLKDAPTPRGERWTRTHTVAGFVLQIPERAGFEPLIDGEFDMNFAGLLRYRHGRGALSFCTLDFAGRVPADPAATRTARAVFDDFLKTPLTANDKPVVPFGAVAARLAAKIKVRTGPDADNALWLVDSGAPKNYADLRAAARSGRTVVVLNAARLAAEAGFKIEKKSLQRVSNAPDSALLRNLGPSLFRWRAPLELELLTAPPAGYTVRADGLVAEAVEGRGKIVFLQLDPFQLRDRYKNDEPRTTATAHSSERMLQLWARMLTNLGAAPAAATTDRLITPMAEAEFAPLRSFFVLGPFQAARDDSRLMLDTVQSGEASAIAGDTAPEAEYPLPQGGTANWRTEATATPDGRVDLEAVNARFKDTPRTVAYAVGFFDRKTAAPAVLRFNVDWRAKIWCNGKPVFRAERGVKGGTWYELKLDNLKPGRNCLTFKIGAGSRGNWFQALLTPEPQSNVVRRRAPELEAVQLYENTVNGLDPYRHRFW